MGRVNHVEHAGCRVEDERNVEWLMAGRGTLQVDANLVVVVLPGGR